MAKNPNQFKSLAEALESPTAVHELRINRKENPEELWQNLAKFPNLRHLDLSGLKGFTELPASLAQLDLTHLLLDFTDVVAIPPELIAAWPNLHTLHLAYTKIAQLPEMLWQRPLQSLRFESMRELTFPEQVWELTTLRELLIYNFTLFELPERAGSLTALEKLDMGSSQRVLTAVPDSIGNLTNLRHLRIWEQLTQLPDSIGNLAELETLNLTGNQLTELPAAIGNLTNLRDLDVHDNLLTVLPPEIGNLTNLTKLNVSARFNKPDEGLVDLPSEIGNLINLDVLTVNHAQLMALPNRIGNLAKLRCFYVRHNQLTAVPPTITQLSNLQYLDLRENQLTGLPDGMAQLTNLRSLELTGNSFPQAEMDKLDALKQASTRYLEIKLPRLAKQKRPSIPAHAYTTDLNSDIYLLAQKLGTTVTMTERGDENWVATKSGRYEMPEPLRQFIDNIQWPMGREYKWEENGEREMWMLDFGYIELGEYECSFHRPFLGIGMYDRGNYFLIIDMTDPQPEDPMVYTLDHESFDEHQPNQLDLRLSELLTKLTFESS